MSVCENINELISGYLDDELVQGDRQRVEIHLRSCSDCQQKLDDMTKLQGAISDGSPKSELSNEQWEKIMNDLPAKASRGIGWILFIAGLITLIGYAVWEFAIDDETTLLVKLATSGVVFGLIFLFISVLRQRLIAFKTDRYKDVQI